MVARVDALTITFVTACSALVSAAAGPFVSIMVASRQIRASLVSNNRERWIEALRDSLAEYVGLALSAAVLQQTIDKDPVAAVRDDPQAARLVERVALVRARILLMVNPLKPEHVELCARIEEAYRILVEGRGTMERIGATVNAITDAGRGVLRSEWARVKRGS